MKTARVYELTVKEQMVPESGLEMEYYKSLPRVFDLSEKVFELHNNKERWPLQTFETVSMPKYKMGCMFEEGYVPFVNTEYIVIDPDIERILSSKFEEEIRDLNGRLTEYRKETVKLLNRVIDFNDLPWYKRVWKTIKGDAV